MDVRRLALFLFLACRSPVPQPASQDQPEDNQNMQPGTDPGPSNDMSMQMPEDVMYGLSARPSNTTCTAFPRPSPSAGVALQSVYPNLSFQEAIWARKQRIAPGGPMYWFFIERTGTMFMAKDGNTKVEFLTIAVDSSQSETGFLSAAFDPDFENNHIVYAFYVGNSTSSSPNAACTVVTANSNGHNMCSYLSRYTVTTSNGGNLFTQSDETVLIKNDKEDWNHNGGEMFFGPPEPDRYLYLTLGDGGGQGDQFNNAQAMDRKLGKMLRLHVRGQTTYTIPPDNPFVGVADAEESIYAVGLRNPWRWTFDRSTSPWSILEGDVGGGEKEEINVITKGKNYGWPCYEGSVHGPDFSDGTKCPTGKAFVAPLLDYGHTGGRIVVTGGYVYRGSALPSLFGSYFFADYGTGEIWLDPDPYGGATPRALPASPILSPPNFNIPAFAEDEANELYVVRASYPGPSLYKIVPTGATTSVGPPGYLSQTGCVKPDAPTQAADGLIPYSINAPFWSDNAVKQRWLALPDGSTASVDINHVTLPTGAVLMKEFQVGGKRVETRLFVRHSDGDWGGYSYRWNAEQSDATLVGQNGVDVAATGTSVPWHIPARAECLTCHATAAGRTLGMDLRQLDMGYVYPANLRANQLATYEHIGLFGSPLANLPGPFANTSLDERARTYLHANCAHCHRPGGSPPTAIDLRYENALAGVCEATPTQGTFGVSGAVLLRPTKPNESLISLRMHAVESKSGHMPKNGRITDSAGLALIDDWVTQMQMCQ